MTDKARLQYEVNPERVDELKNIMEICNIRTRTELFNNALSLFEWAVEEVQAGRVISSVDENNEKYYVLKMPVLIQAAKHSNNK